MEITIKSQEQKALLKRTEVLARVAFKGATPSRKELRGSIAKSLKTDEKLVVIREILTNYGDQVANITAFVYEDESSLKLLESAAIMKRHGGGQQSAGGDDKAEPNAQNSADDGKAAAPKAEKTEGDA